MHEPLFHCLESIIDNDFDIASHGQLVRASQHSQWPYAPG